MLSVHTIKNNMWGDEYVNWVDIIVPLCACACVCVCVCVCVITLYLLWCGCRLSWRVHMLEGWFPVCPWWEVEEPLRVRPSGRSLGHCGACPQKDWVLLWDCSSWEWVLLNEQPLLDLILTSHLVPCPCAPAMIPSVMRWCNQWGPLAVLVQYFLDFQSPKLWAKGIYFL
jgi:hypothetical protein